MRPNLYLTVSSNNPKVLTSCTLNLQHMSLRSWQHVSAISNDEGLKNWYSKKIKF